jgi:hypothetical protein
MLKLNLRTGSASCRARAEWTREGRIAVKAILTAALVLAVSTSAALADGAVELTDAEMDRVTAGVFVRGGFGELRVGGNQRRLGDDVIDTTLALVSNQPTDRSGFVPLDLDDVQNLFESR